MVHARLVVLVVLAGCRIGFDPIAGASPDGGVDASSTGVASCDPGTPCSAIASPGSLFALRCTAGQHCLVECEAAARCLVDCNGASSCIVTCPATGCAVTDCVGPTCEVLCGGTTTPTAQGSTATCP